MPHSAQARAGCMNPVTGIGSGGRADLTVFGERARVSAAQLVQVSPVVTFVRTCGVYL